MHRTGPATVLFLGASACSLACSRGPRPDVVIVVVDTLRWDALSMNGAPWPTTPTLDRLATQARTMDRGYASSSWTLASTASILTGRHPTNHGLVNPGLRLNPDAGTLAELLTDHGYHTASVVSNPLVATAPELLAGFATRESRVDDFGSTAPELTRLALAQLQPNRPDFVYIHYMDPHYPYLNHADLDWAPAEGVGRLKGGETIDTLRGLELTPAELDFLRACYAEEVHAVDAAIGSLLEGLEPDTLLMVTSDHGEEFLERGWLGHVRTVHEELVHVPLFLGGPGVEPGRTDAPTLNGGFFATVADVLDIRAPRHLQLPDLRAPTGEGVMVEVEYDPQSLTYAAKAAHARAWIERNHKLIRDRERGTATYHLATDPLEQVPLEDTTLLPKLDAAHEAAAIGALERNWKSADEKAREMLQALGYLD